MRERAFLDREPDPGQVPRGILDFIEEIFPALVAAWDELYPHNPVQSEDAWNAVASSIERKTIESRPAGFSVVSAVLRGWLQPVEQGE